MSGVRRFAALCLAIAGWIALPASALAEELVTFDGAAGRGAPLQGYLTKPKGGGPFPAVVLLHSCLGLPSNRQTIGATFAGWGYVALFVDDFTTRGLKETCSRELGEAVPDAVAGLAYLARLPYVDAKRVAAVGYSQGGDTALQLASGRYDFMAAIAVYPPCANQANAALQIPTLILIGRLDEVTPAADCEALARAQQNAKLVVFPGASHLFDDPSVSGGKRVSGMWLKYDADAAAKARAEMRAFLAAKLGG